MGPSQNLLVQRKMAISDATRCHAMSQCSDSAAADTANHFVPEVVLTKRERTLALTMRVNA
jgi:hypothetical protein